MVILRAEVAGNHFTLFSKFKTYSSKLNFNFYENHLANSTILKILWQKMPVSVDLFRKP